MYRSLRITAVAVAIGSLALFGCSSGDDNADTTTTTAPATTTTTDPNAEFVTQLNDLCRTGDEASTQAGNDFESALSDIQAASQANDQEAYRTALDDAETATESILGAIDDFQTAVDGLDVPADLQADLTTYLDSLDEQKSLAEDLRTAIVNDDGQAFTDAVNAIQSADESSRQTRTDAANALGASECVPDSADDTSTTDTTVAGGAAETTDTTAG